MQKSRLSNEKLCILLAERLQNGKIQSLRFKENTRATLIVDLAKMDALARQKNQKRHFLRDIEKSFEEVALIGPEPHQFFPF